MRQRTDEDGDNHLQDEKYACQRAAYRQARDNPTDPTPDLYGPERTAGIVAAAQERDHATRVEEQRRKVGVTPEVFLANALQGAAGYSWRELRALWIARGGKAEDLRRAVKEHYRFRGGEYGGEALYVERRDAPGPDRDSAPVVDLYANPAVEPEPQPVGDWRSHPLACECDDCLHAPVLTTYTRPSKGAKP